MHDSEQNGYVAAQKNDASGVGYSETPEIVDFEGNDYEVKQYESFESMDLKKELLDAIYFNGFDKPSPIQKKGIVPIIKRKNVIAQAQSGTGKTATFCIAAIQIIDVKLNYPQILILCPTRELASQVQVVCCSLAKRLKIKVVSCIGGTELSATSKDISSAHVIVGCPGRVTHTLQAGLFSYHDIKLTVFDEADEFMSKGFVEQIQPFLGSRSKNTTVAFFSATYSNDVKDLIDLEVQDTVKIDTDTKMLTLEGISQFYAMVQHDSWKQEVLDDLYEKFNISQTIIYVNKKAKLFELRQYLEANDHTISCIYAGMPPHQRKDVMEQFRRGDVRILLSTDLLARGIDIQQVSLVVNFDLPRADQTYIHRIGRSGRYGRKGIAINIILPEELSHIERLQQHYNCQIAPIPDDIEDYIKSAKIDNSNM